MLLSSAKGQTFADKEVYLVDSLDLSVLEEIELEIIESSIEKFHGASNEMDKVSSIVYIIEESWDYNVWPKYNEWLEGYIGSLLKKKGLSEKELWHYKEAMAIVINTKGYYFDEKGNIPLAIDFYHQALKIREEIGDLEGMALSYNNIGSVYHYMEDYSLALQYYEMSLGIQKELQDTIGMSRSYSNMGAIYHLWGEQEKGIDLMIKSLELKEMINDLDGLASGYINLGITFKLMEEFDLAKDYYEKGLSLYEDINNDRGISAAYYNLGNLSFKTGDYKNALSYLLESLKIAQKEDLLIEVQDASEILSGAYEKLGNYKESLSMYKLFISMRDSISSEEALKSTIELQTKYEYEKKAATDSIKNAEAEKLYLANLEAEKAEVRAKKKQNVFLFIGLGLVALFGFFMFNRFKVTQKQKNIIDEQRKEVELTHEQLAEHHKEIQDSIVYAKRIQEAIMPSMNSMNAALKSGFVLYLPKDVVAGDFFWMEQMEDIVYYAAADCTGHGVPGAMVSVVCSNALSKALLEERRMHVGQLLDRTRDIVVERLAKSGEEVKDGMDISLCALNRNTGELRWAGANNPLWVLREGADQIEEIKANKQPIGKYADPVPFTEHLLQLNSGDSIYVFTDGFQDQFGGEKGKKYKPSQLKEFLLSIQGLSLDEQKVKLHEEFVSWKGSLEQLDDVCFIAVRI